LNRSEKIITDKMPSNFIFLGFILSANTSIVENGCEYLYRVVLNHARMSHPFRMVTIKKMWGIRFLIAICVALGAALAGESVAGGSLDPISIAPPLPGTRTEEPGPGMFLVAKRALDGPHFGQSVVYLVEHGEGGTLGLIVNRSSDISLSEALPDIEDKQATAHALYYGGPVGLPMIFILVRSESPSEGMVHVANNVYISADRRVLDEVLAVKKPKSEVRFYIGHSGWAAGQLDFELERGSWHVVAADTDAIFSGETDSLWNRLIERLEPRGIEVDNRPGYSPRARTGSFLSLIYQI
jgi:putative transcriptional regulator